MSTVFDKVEYVPLETTPDCLLKPGARMFVTDKYIVAINVFDKACLFDRKSGKFLHQIGREGQGPEEYRRYMLHFNPLDERRNMVYAYDVTQYKGYDIETGKLKTIVKYNPENKFIASLWALDNDKYITTIPNFSGNEPAKAQIIDKNGTVLKTYPNYSFYDPTLCTQDERPDSGFTLFYNLGGKLYMTPTFLRDTAYLVTDKALIPHFAIRTGNKPFGKTKEENSVAGKKILRFVRETSRYVFFHYGIGHYAFGLYSGYYDKQTKQVYITSTLKNGKDHGFQNDIDGLSSFTPRHVNEKQEVIGSIIPEEILDHVERNGTSSLSARAKALVKNMQEDDNPVVVIAQPKK